MSAEGNLSLELKLSFTFLLSYMQMCMSVKTGMVYMWGSSKTQLNFGDEAPTEYDGFFSGTSGVNFATNK